MVKIWSGKQLAYRRRTTVRPGYLKFFITERTNVLAPVRPIAMQGGTWISVEREITWQNEVAKRLVHQGRTKTGCQAGYWFGCAV